MTTVLKLDEIKRLIDIPQLIREIEAGFVLYSEGQVKVPPVGFLHFDDPPGDVHIKYGFVSGDDYYVLKMASGFYKNPELGLPVSDGLLLVFSQKTGGLKLILLDKCWLTDMRTAAAGAVAAKHLAARNIHHIGIVGTGVQARMQLEMLRDVIDCRSCFIWGRDPTKVQRMIEDLQSRERIQMWGLEIKAAEVLDDLVSQCNLIVTTTSARNPLIRADLVQEGTHITAMGSDDHGKQELEAKLLAKADLVVADSISQCVDHGECCAAVQGGQIREDTILELGQVIKNPTIGRTSEDQITVVDLTGVAIQDIQIAKIVDRALSSPERGAELA
ncbi:MAG TPA: ornithine cyclodeaminase family protein [Gemmatimonadetes bacterium]|nr:ornithine cyclodeaminase family protein [Gemmatimonadota bacterium]HIL89360.1 ornithine cyclodeaminase family protein [Gemmatimonadota bacterium]